MLLLTFLLSYILLRPTSYTDKQETEKKIVSQIFIKDDKAFLTGDLMFSDEENFLYFADRVGDTFRWKGERTMLKQWGEFFFANLHFLSIVF